MMDMEELITLAEKDITLAVDDCFDVVDGSLLEGNFEAVNKFFIRLTEHHLEDLIEHPSLAVSFLMVAPNICEKKYPARSYFYHEFKKELTKKQSDEEVEALLYGLEPEE